MAQLSAPAPATPAKTVLIVDDDADIRAVLSEFLQDEGYATATADNGREALAYLQRHPRTSIILLDLMMPVMNGYQFIRQQKSDASVAAIPVVVMTANGAFDSTLIGATKVLAKPMDLDDLLRSLSAAGAG